MPLPTDPEFKLSDYLTPLFAVPVIKYQWHDVGELNKALRKHILKLEETTPSASASMINGWQSDRKFLASKKECVIELNERIASIVQRIIRDSPRRPGNFKLEYSFYGWANVIRRGNYNALHSHPHALWSCVYYVDAGKPDPKSHRLNGCLEFQNPITAEGMMKPPAFRDENAHLIQPKTGLMVFFPSWMKHMVHPFEGSGTRISVASNINIFNAPR